MPSYMPAEVFDDNRGKMVMDAKKATIDRVIQGIEHLPTLPQVVMRVLAMAESPRISAIVLSKAMDQSLAAKVLKVSNSAYYGGRSNRNINSIHHAIVMIGFEAVKEIILTRESVTMASAILEA